MSQFQLVTLEVIIASKTNPRKRFNQAALDELTASVRSHGVLQPILLRPNGAAGHYEIVAGERRWRAAKAAGLADIPATVRELTDAEVLEIQVVENLQREDLHPLEEAEGYESLMKCKHGDGHTYTADEIAAKVGKSRSYVYQRLKLTALVPAAREAFYEGHLDPSRALLIARVPEELQQQALEELTEEAYAGAGDQMTFREARDHLRRAFMLDLGKPPFDVKAIYFAGGKATPIGVPCAECPKRTGNQPELFEDVKSGDVCTDPPCFQGKTIAHAETLAESLRAKGHTVLTGKDAKKVLAQDWASARGGYVRLDKPLADDPNYKPLAQHLGKKAPPATYVELPGSPGKFVKCVDEKAAREALITAGKNWADKKAATPGKAVKTRDYETEYAIEQAIHKALRDAVREKGLDETALRALVVSLSDFVGAAITDLSPEVWRKPGTMPAAELQPALVDCAFSESDFDKERHALATHYGIDVKEIERQVKAQRKAEAEKEAAAEKAKPAKATKAKKPKVTAEQGHEAAA